MHYKLSQFNIISPKSSTMNDIFVAQPDSIKEGLAGKIFILSEITEKSADAEKIKNFLFQNIYFTYYNNEKILLREKVSSLKVEHLFEAAIAKINKNFAEFIKNEKINIPISKINIVIGVLFENQLHFSGNGRNKIYFIHKRTTSTTDNQLREDFIVSDISASIDQTSNQSATDKLLFRELLSGELPDKSLFFFSNEALPEYLSQEQLKQILISLPPSSAAEQIKNSLAAVNSFISFSGLIVKRVAFEKDESISVVQRVGTKASILNLNETEDTTDSLLAPSGLVNPKRWLAIFKPFEQKTGNKSVILLKDKIYSKKRDLLLKTFFTALKNILIYSINFLIFTATSAKKLPQLINIIKSIQLKNVLIVFWQKITSLNWAVKVSISALVIISVFFIYNIQKKNVDNILADNTKKHDEILLQIQKKQNENEFNTMIKDDGKVRNTLAEISKLLAELPQDSEAQKASYTQIKKQYEEQLSSLDKITSIRNPKIVADFSKLANSNPQAILHVPEKNKFYALDYGSGIISAFNLTNNTGIVIATGTPNIVQSILQKNKIIIFDSQKILSIDIGSDALQIVSDKQDKEIVASDSYNDNIYLLSSKDNEIYKYNSSDRKFTNPQKWLKESADLSNCIDLSITGDIYILKNNGEVFKYALGKKKDFKLPEINPPLTSPQKIYVSTNADLIYILEPSIKRLILFTKTDNRYLMQYNFENFDNIKDFFIDEKNNKIYLLNNASVFEIPVTETTN